ncbi:MAG TPA: hypothetical protein VFY93_20110 [Planctomycetota bacterium]|nr:hypothetical protein [Planctomycetota bacterium]
MATRDLIRRGADAVRLEATRAGPGLWRHRARKLVFIVRRGQDLRAFSKR